MVVPIHANNHTEKHAHSWHTDLLVPSSVYPRVVEVQQGAIGGDGGIRTFLWTGYTASPRLLRYCTGLIQPSFSFGLSLLQYLRYASSKRPPDCRWRAPCSGSCLSTGPAGRRRSSRGSAKARPCRPRTGSACARTTSRSAPTAR